MFREQSVSFKKSTLWKLVSQWAAQTARPLILPVERKIVLLTPAYQRNGICLHYLHRICVSEIWASTRIGYIDDVIPSKHLHWNKCLNAKAVGVQRVLKLQTEDLFSKLSEKILYTNKGLPLLNCQMTSRKYNLAFVPHPWLLLQIFDTEIQTEDRQQIMKQHCKINLIK